MATEEALFAAKRAAKEQLHDIEGVLGFGIGDGTIRVYVLNSEAIPRLPAQIEDIPIEVIVTGEIVAGS